jgi:hypothetical protein
MHDRHIAFPLIDDGLEADLAPVPARPCQMTNLTLDLR